MNHLGLGTSYDEIERIDTALVQRTVDMAGFHRVPVPPSIVSDNIVHGAMDNFNHNENIDPGIGGSHILSSCYFKMLRTLKTTNCA